MIEYLYKSGKMPLRYYNQLNDKTAQENYEAYQQEIRAKSLLLDKKAYGDLEKCIESAIDDIIKSLSKP